MTEEVENLIIGGGQAGLAMSYWLGQTGRQHLIIERGRIAERWQSERWDSLCLLSQNWSVSLPNYPYAGPDSEGFMTRDEVTAWILGFAAGFDPPVRTDVNVRRLRRANGNGAPGWLAETTAGDFRAQNVVVATGPFGDTSTPAWNRDLPAGIFQVHSNAYRNPGQLPPGAVLVVGSGASGFQIVEDLLDGQRRVYFSLGRHDPRVRRYRGRDHGWWMGQLGQWERKLEDFPNAKFESRGAITGAKGGHDLNLRKLAAEGVTILGRARAVDDYKLAVAPDLPQNVREADERAVRARTMIDAFIEREGVDAPPEPPAKLWPDPEELLEPLSDLDLRAAGISSVIWATGFRYKFDWIEADIFEADGEPRHLRGIPPAPGLYFLGLRWLYKFKSSFIHGVDEDAQYLAQHIAERA
jgi:putative flavoprotein involved in K+ transport